MLLTAASISIFDRVEVLAVMLHGAFAKSWFHGVIQSEVGHFGELIDFFHHLDEVNYHIKALVLLSDEIVESCLQGVNLSWVDLMSELIELENGISKKDNWVLTDCF